MKYYIYWYNNDGMHESVLTAGSMLEAASKFQGIHPEGIISTMRPE